MVRWAPAPSTGGSGLTLAALTDVNVTSRVDKSVLYFDTASSKWRGDSDQTVGTLTDFGNF